VNPHAPTAARMWTWSTSNDSSVSDAALGPAPRAELLHILMLPDVVRTRRVAPSPNFSFDCEEDRTLRAVLVGMLREAGR